MQFVTSFQYSASHFLQVWLMNPVCLLPIVPISPGSSAYHLLPTYSLFSSLLSQSEGSLTTTHLYSVQENYCKTKIHNEKVVITSCRNIRTNMFCLFVSSSLNFLSIFCLCLTDPCMCFICFIYCSPCVQIS